MIIILIRTIILYAVVLFVLRVMGKGEMSKMDPFQMVILFMIAELASLPIESPDISILTGITALFTLLFLQVLISYISLKSEWFKGLVSGKPTLLMNQGALNLKEMNALRISINDLTQQLRLKNCPSLTDIDYAILEVNGDLSVIPKKNKRPLTPEDLSMLPPKETLPKVIISDGILYKNNLVRLQITENQLKSHMLTLSFYDYKEVFLCISDEKDSLHFYPKAGCKERIEERTKALKPKPQREHREGTHKPNRGDTQ